MFIRNSLLRMWFTRLSQGIAERTYEVDAISVDVLKVSKPLAGFDGAVTYHDSWGLRGLTSNTALRVVTAGPA